jgi:hypothetical protein
MAISVPGYGYDRRQQPGSLVLTHLLDDVISDLQWNIRDVEANLKGGRNRGETGLIFEWTWVRVTTPRSTMNAPSASSAMV